MFDKIQMILMMKTSISNNRLSPLNKSLNFKLRPDLSINSRDIESLSIETLFYKERNTLMFCTGLRKELLNRLKDF